MSNIPLDEIKTMIKKTVFASGHGVPEAVFDAIKPLYIVGDLDDHWLFTKGCLAIVASTLARPAPGVKAYLATVKSDGRGGVDPGSAQAADEARRAELMELDPTMTCYMELLTAELNEDVDESMNAFNRAVNAGVSAEVTAQAVYEAGVANRNRVAALQ